MTIDEDIHEAMIGPNPLPTCDFPDLKIERTGGGMTQLSGTTVRNSEIPYPFGVELWEEFLDANGDLTVLSETLNANQPKLDLFDEFAGSFRRNMLKRHR